MESFLCPLPQTAIGQPHEHNHILELIGKGVLLGIATVPDLCFAKKAEARALDHLGRFSEAHPCQRRSSPRRPVQRQQPTAGTPYRLCACRTSPASPQRSESESLAFLADRKRGQVNRHNSILAERQAVIGMAGDLENEIAVSPLVQHLAGRRLAHGQATQDERSRAKSHVLLSFLALQAHHTTALRLPQLVFGNHQLWPHPFQSGAGGLQSDGPARVLPEHTPGVPVLQLSPRVSVEPSSTRVGQVIWN